MNPIQIAKHYFDLSNKSDFKAIAKLFSDTATYISPATGIFLGKDSIIAMQKEFHAKFSSLNWKVNSTKETKPGTIVFDYDFSGKTKDGDDIKSSGLEYVTIHNNKIQHIEINSMK